MEATRVEATRFVEVTLFVEVTWEAARADESDAGPFRTNRTDIARSRPGSDHPR